MSATIRFEEWLEGRMADPDFRAEWEASEPGFQVALLRIRRGLTQAQLAELVGTTQSSIARLESGRTAPRLSFLRRVVGALRGQLTIQITGSEDREPQNEATPAVRAAASDVTAAWAFSGLTWQSIDLFPATDRQDAVAGGESCYPDDVQRYGYTCISEATAEEETAVPR